jgi:hypothetical protein
METRSPDGDLKESPDSDDSMHAAAQDVLDAIKAGDVARLASAIRSAFEIMDASPHVEGEHINEEEV